MMRYPVGAAGDYLRNLRRVTGREAITDYHVLYAATLLEFPDLPDEVRLFMLSMAVDTCPYCHEQNRACQCQADNAIPR